MVIGLSEDKLLVWLTKHLPSWVQFVLLPGLVKEGIGQIKFFKNSFNDEKET